MNKCHELSHDEAIIPTVIELDADIIEIKKQYLKEQLTNPIILFGQKYGLKEFTVKNSQYPDLRRSLVKLVRLEEKESYS